MNSENKISNRAAGLKTSRFLYRSIIKLTQHVEADSIADAIRDVETDATERHQQHESPKRQRPIDTRTLVFRIVAGYFTRVIPDASRRVHRGYEARRVRGQESLSAGVEVNWGLKVATCVAAPPGAEARAAVVHTGICYIDFLDKNFSA